MRKTTKLPYINPEDRRHYEEGLNFITNLLSQRQFAQGDLTYIIYRLLIHAEAYRGTRYSSLSVVRASALDAALEFYRRRIAPYEDEKIRLNGDIH